MDSDTYRRLAEALDEIALWAVLAPLLPFAVHHDARAERLAARIPRQRNREITLPRRTEAPRR